LYSEGPFFFEKKKWNKTETRINKIGRRRVQGKCRFFLVEKGTFAKKARKE